LGFGVALMGIGSASIFPTLFSFVEELIPVTSRIGSLFSVASCLADYTIPLIVGYFVEDYPLALIYVTTIASIACLILFFILCLDAKYNGKIFKNQRVEINERR
jgi:MFS family permease